MPILGVGTDIVETQRIRELYEREPGFASRVFTERELAYCLSKATKFMNLSARFAAKEAVAKALGGAFGWKEVELINDAEGKPQVVLYGRALAAADGAVVHVSISHTRDYSSAVAVIEK